MTHRCVECGRGPLDTPSVSLYRQNAPGELPAIWACAEHSVALIDEEVTDIVAVVEGRKHDA